MVKEQTYFTHLANKDISTLLHIHQVELLLVSSLCDLDMRVPQQIFYDIQQ